MDEKPKIIDAEFEVVEPGQTGERSLAEIIRDFGDVPDDEDFDDDDDDEPVAAAAETEPGSKINALIAEALSAAVLFGVCFYFGVASEGRVMLAFQVVGVGAMGSFGRAVWALIPALRARHRARSGGGSLQLL